MTFKLRRIWIPLAFAGLLLAGCNFPTPTEEPPTEAADAVLVEPTPIPSDIPIGPTATVAPISEDGIAPTTSAEHGLRVAYTDGVDLWVLEQGSAPRQLTDTGGVGEVRISDDGEWIAYVVWNEDQSTADLRSVSFDGNTHLLLMSAAGFDALYPLEGFAHRTISKMGFLPNSNTLLFNTRGVFEGPGLAKEDNLGAIDVSIGLPMELLARGEGGDFTPSPDGSQIAIVRPDSIGFVGPDGSNLRSEVLTFTPVITYSEFLFYPLPVWSSSGVVLSIPREDPFFGAEPGTVWTVNGEAQILAHPQGDLYAPQFVLPITSPDGLHLAYSQLPNVAGEQDLVIQKLDTGEQIIYDSGVFEWKGWGPDSYLFAYTKGSGLDLYLGDLLGEPEPLGSGMGLTWINAKKFLYLAGSPGSWTLTLADTSGSKMPLAVSSSSAVSYDFAD